MAKHSSKSASLKQKLKDETCNKCTICGTHMPCQCYLGLICDDPNYKKVKQLQKSGLDEYYTWPTSSWSIYQKRLRLFLFCVMWYILNVIYNIYNKKAVIKLNLPLTIGAAQLLVGWFFFGTLWILRLRPIPRIHSFKIFFFTFLPQGFFHMLVHLGAILSMAWGAVSFAQVIKAAEPILTALLSYLFLNQILLVKTMTSLLAIVVGVILVSIEEATFTYSSLFYAMVSNFGSAARGIAAKSVMIQNHDIGSHLSPSNVYNILNIVSTLMFIPLALVFEHSQYATAWKNATTLPDGSYNSKDIIIYILVSGICYYLYNEFSFLCLNEIHQVTHSIVNTLKRVTVIAVAMLVFKTPVSYLGAFGAALALVGAFAYSLFK